MRPPTGFGPVKLGAGLTTVYTAPEKVRLSTITLVNNTAGAISADVRHVPAGVAASADHQIVPLMPIPPNDTLILPGANAGSGGSRGVAAWLMLEPGDTIQALGTNLLLRGVTQPEN